EFRADVALDVHEPRRTAGAVAGDGGAASRTAAGLRQWRIPRVLCNRIDQNEIAATVGGRRAYRYQSRARTQGMDRRPATYFQRNPRRDTFCARHRDSVERDRRRWPGRIHIRRVSIAECSLRHRNERSQSRSQRRASRCDREEHRAMTPTGPFILHITRVGERWDLLAWRYYGDPTDYSPIIMANFNVPIEPVFDGGISIAVPILQKSAVAIANLPPWKMSQAVSA